MVEISCKYHRLVLEWVDKNRAPAFPPFVGCDCTYSWAAIPHIQVTKGDMCSCSWSIVRRNWISHDFMSCRSCEETPCRDEMTLFLARSHIILSTPRCYASPPRLQVCSKSIFRLQLVQHRHRHVLIRSSAAALESGGSDDEPGFLSPTSDTSDPVLKISSSEAKEPWISRVESTVERTIFDFRFLTLMAIGGSLVGSLLCFLKGCGFICDSYMAYFVMCLNGLHTGKVILRLVEAVEIYLVGTVMLIFGMGLFGLFISNDSENGHRDRALQNTTLFGMFALKKRPLWMQITSLDTLKTKLGHCIVMILFVKLFEKSKTVCIATSVDLLLYSVAIFLAAGSLYVLQKLHASQFSGT